MTDPSRPQGYPNNAPPQSGLLAPGTVIPSAQHPGGRSIVIDDRPNYTAARVVDERVTRDWEYVTVARPVDLHEKIVEVPTTRTLQTLVPKIQVREILKTIPKDQPEYVEEQHEITHSKIIDKYVEVPIVSGTEVKYVPKVEMRERTVKMTKPEIKWVEKIIEIPQIKEVVRYVESDKNIEQVIRYVPKRKDGDQKGDGISTVHYAPPYSEMGDGTSGTAGPYPGYAGQHPIYGARPGVYTPRGVVPLSQTEGSRRSPGSLPPSPRLERMEQLFIPRVAKTVEVEKEIPVTVDVPVPFMVPKPVQVPVEVPVLRFRDHFIPVPIRRHVIPRIVFTDEVYEVDCTKEKPVLVVEDRFKPVPVDVKIKLKEKDIKVIPIDPAELSQADFHAMWMRVNADLFERCKETGIIPDSYLNASGENLQVETTDDAAAAYEQEETFKEGGIDESEEQKEERRRIRREEREERRRKKQERAAAKKTSERTSEQQGSVESIKDPTGPPDFGPLPLHPGHPLMMTYLQNQWIQNPSTVTHNMYTPELFRLHASALDSVLHPQPHQVNITQEQSVQLGPLPSEQIPSPWTELNIGTAGQRPGKGRGGYTTYQGEMHSSDGTSSYTDSDLHRYQRTGCSPCSNCCAP